MWLTELAVIAAMILFNGALAAYEIALASVSRARLDVLAQAKVRGAKAALAMKEHIEGSLAVVQLGITLVGAIAAATGGVGAGESIAPRLRAHLALSRDAAEVLAIALVVVPLTVVTIVFGELIPKVFALRNQEWVALRMSPVMQWLALVARPAVWLLETLVQVFLRWAQRRWKPAGGVASSEAAALQELRSSAAIARASRLIGSREERIILGAASLSRRPVREAMLPADQISLLPLEISMADALIAAHLDMHSRFPVVARPGDPQSILGYVSFKDIVAQMRLSPHEPSLRALVRELPRFTAETPVATCLEQMMRQHAHIALVAGDDEMVLGMITLEDIIEELVGEIEDEYDRLPAHVVVSGRGWIVGGGISLERLRTMTGVDLASDLPGQPARNVHEWFVGHLGHAVHGGEILERSGLRLLVRKIRRQKVMELQLEPPRR